MSTLTELVKTEYTCLEGQYFAWVGQNATTGTPNRLTGRMSMFGDFYSFSTASERDDFINDFRDFSGNRKAVKCTINTGRKFALGITQRQYLEILSYAQYRD